MSLYSIDYGDPVKAVELAIKYAMCTPLMKNTYGATHIFEAIGWCKEGNLLILEIIRNTNSEVLKAEIPSVAFTQGPCNALITNLFFYSLYQGWQSIYELNCHFQKNHGPILNHLIFNGDIDQPSATTFWLDLMNRFPNLESITDHENQKPLSAPLDLITKIFQEGKIDQALKVAKFTRIPLFEQFKGHFWTNLEWTKWFFETAVHQEGITLPSKSDVEIFAWYAKRSEATEVVKYLCEHLPQKDLRPTEEDF